MTPSTNGFGFSPARELLISQFPTHLTLNPNPLRAVGGGWWGRGRNAEEVRGEAAPRPSIDPRMPPSLNRGRKED